MPFPLAHPAAVLPLRRCSTRHFNFPALLIGTIVPDLSYCLEKYDADLLAHSIRGCFLFSLPVGWGLMLIFYAIAEPLASLLPAPHREALLPACRKPDQRWFVIPLSLVIGAATHVLWDSLTHDTGWIVEHSSFLQLNLFSWEGHSFRVYRVLWHASTWISLLLLYRAYAQMLQGRTGPAASLSTDEKRRYALGALLFGLPAVGAVLTALLYHAHGLSDLSTVPQFLRLSAALYLVLVSVLLAAIGAALKMKRRSPGSPPTRRADLRHLQSCGKR
jgi:Domain of unknown function (DUF4184)